MQTALLNGNLLDIANFGCRFYIEKAPYFSIPDFFGNVELRASPVVKSPDDAGYLPRFSSRVICPSNRR
jgi:hypothetical protein